MKLTTIILLTIFASSTFISCGEDNNFLPSKNNDDKETTHERRIADKIISLSPGKLWRFSFTITNDMIAPHISGHFDVIAGNDAEVILFNDNNYHNWRNKKESSAIYFSGRIAADTFYITLYNADTYHLIISNTFSIFTSKKVEIKATLTYTYW